MNMIIRLLIRLSLPLLLMLSPASWAGQCDALFGQAFGLCTAGVAVGCDEKTGSEQACARIEEKFLEATGEEAPWVSVCPCDYSQVSLALQGQGGPWPAKGGNYYFDCPEIPDTGVFSSRSRFMEKTVPSKLYAWVDTSDTWPAKFQCHIYAGKIAQSVILYEDVTALGRACRADLIAYAKAFMTLHPELVIGNNTCRQ